MKKLIIKLAKFFIPEGKRFLRRKDILYTHPAEHLWRCTSYIQHHFGTPKGTILDIGAADGGTAFYFANQFPNCNVLAFEPIPEMAEIAKQKCSGVSQIQIINCALSDKEEQIVFHVTKNKLSSSILPFDNENAGQFLEKESQLEIQTKTLDQYTESITHIPLLKIDVQGAELKVLKGGLNTLKKTQTILIEMNNHQQYQGGVQYHEMDQFLRENGFRLADVIVTYRPKGEMSEYDALYVKAKV
jgi:FkbM family methyltransferase